MDKNQAKALIICPDLSMCPSILCGTAALVPFRMHVAGDDIDGQDKLKGSSDGEAFIDMRNGSRLC